MNLKLYVAFAVLILLLTSKINKGIFATFYLLFGSKEKCVRCLTAGVRKNLTHNFDMLPAHNTIFLVTYPHELVEYLIPSLIPNTTICYVAAPVAAKPLKLLVYEPNEFVVLNSDKNNYDFLKKQLIGKVDRMSVWVYANSRNSRVHDYDVGRMRTGMFYIARDLNVTITPVVVNSYRCKKFNVTIGDTMYVDYVDPMNTVKKVRKFMRNCKTSFHKQCLKNDFP